MHTRQRRGNHMIRALTVIAGIGSAAWNGGLGIAHANPSQEQQACALMDDSAAAIHFGYGNSTPQYAYAVLSRQMPADVAAQVISAATRTHCPHHAAELPPGWR
ncbi:hypothetical protein [Mycobacterium camsae]|uniref:hypothetical protein n=1 Tax=Mycobacterium gordonae TaxID=1778 RepID=UPI00197EDA90|nr:hypothetical protein [Mycobacterium gordonae]